MAKMHICQSNCVCFSGLLFNNCPSTLHSLSLSNMLLNFFLSVFWMFLLNSFWCTCLFYSEWFLLIYPSDFYNLNSPSSCASESSILKLDHHKLWLMLFSLLVCSVSLLWFWYSSHRNWNLIKANFETFAQFSLQVLTRLYELIVNS